MPDNLIRNRLELSLKMKHAGKFVFISLMFLLIVSMDVSGITVSYVTDNISGIQGVYIEIQPKENCGFRIHDVPQKIRGDNIMNYWNRTNDELVINGGFYRPDFLPLGLCKIDGVAIGSGRPNNRSGYIAINKNGAIAILTRKDDHSHYATILQSGPYVIDPGGHIGIKKESKTNDFPSRRTLVGKKFDNGIVIMSIEPIYLFDLAKGVKRRFPEIERLLNLDGGPSTGLATSITTITNTKPVRNYIVKKRVDTSR